MWSSTSQKCQGNGIGLHGQNLGAHSQFPLHLNSPSLWTFSLRYLPSRNDESVKVFGETAGEAKTPSPFFLSTTDCSFGLRLIIWSRSTVKAIRCCPPALLRKGRWRQIPDYSQVNRRPAASLTALRFETPLTKWLHTDLMANAYRSPFIFVILN